MADKSKSVQSSSIQRFGSRLRFGLLGTLALVGAVSFLSPLAAGIITTALAAGFVAHEVIAPSWTKGGRWLKNVLHGNKTTVTAPGSGKPISVSQGQPTGNSLVDALVVQLRKSGLSVSTDWDAGKKVLAGLPDSYELFKKPDSKVYGFVYQGNIFINPTETSADVPIHEYTHLWAEALRQQNAEEWKNIVQMMKQDVDLWQQVKSTYTHLTTDDEIADEVLATYSGRHGAQRLAEHCKNGETPEQVFQGVLGALERFWKHVAQFFNIHYTSREDVADRVLSDFLKGVNPHTYIDQNKITLSDRTPLASAESLSPTPLNNQLNDKSSMHTELSPQEVTDLMSSLPEQVRHSLSPMLHGTDEEISRHIMNYRMEPVSGVFSAGSALGNVAVIKLLWNSLSPSDKAAEQTMPGHFKDLDAIDAYGEKWQKQERMYNLLRDLLPEDGKISLPRSFGLDQPVAVNTYDMDAKYIVRSDDTYRLSDGEYTLPVSKVQSHQLEEFCQLLDECKENASLRISDSEDNRVSNGILAIRSLAASVGGHQDVDIFLQHPVPLGNGVHVVGVNVALSNVRDDKVILKHEDIDKLNYSDYRFYDEDWQNGVRVYNTLDSQQLTQVYGELKEMQERHTLFPVVKDSGSLRYASFQGVAPDNAMLSSLRHSSAVDGVSQHDNALWLTMESADLSSSAQLVRERAFDLEVYRTAQSLMNRNLAIKEDDGYVVVLATGNLSNVAFSGQPLKNTGGDAIESLKIIATGFDPTASVVRESDRIVKVRFSDDALAKSFTNAYFRRDTLAADFVSPAYHDRKISPLGRTFANAYLVEHGGVDKGRRELAAKELLQQSRYSSLKDSDAQLLADNYMELAHTIPVVVYRDAEARQIFDEIMAGEQSTEVADYFPLHIGACGIFKDTSGDGHQVFVAFDNSSGDNWVEQFKTERAAELYCGGTISADDLHKMEQEGFKTLDKPLVVDTIILSKENLPASLHKDVTFDEHGEAELKMAFFDGFAEEVNHRDGVILPDNQRLKLTYPTLSAVASNKVMQQEIEDFTDRSWRSGEDGEKVYDIALKYGKVSRLYEISHMVDNRNADIEVVAQDALYQRITREPYGLTGEQKQALSAYQQSFGIDADKSVYLSERLMRGIQDRLASSGVPETVINDAQHEVTEFFRGVERDMTQRTEKDFINLVLPYLNDKYESVLIPASVPVHENPSGQYAHQVNKTQDYILQSLGVLFNVEHQTMQVVYDHHHTMENGHEYHTVLGLPFDQLTPKEVNSLYDTLQGDLEEKGKLLIAGITEREDENEEVLFDVAFDVSSDEEQQALADKHHAEGIDEENNISCFNDYDDAVYFAAENLAALQQRPDLVQDLRDKSSVVDIIIERMKDPAARAFTPEQAQAVRSYIFQSDDVKSRLADANDLFYSAASSPETKNIPSSWKEDVKDELSDLAKGIFRDESRGFHR